jgi:hypothetical protein
MARVVAVAAGEPRRAGNLLVSDMVGSPSRNKVGLMITQTARLRCQSVAVANGRFGTAAYGTKMDMTFA